MAVDLTALEKYNELSLDDRDSLGSLSSEDPEVTLAIASRQLDIFETVKWWTDAIVISLSLCALVYIFGLPESFVGFMSGVLGFWFIGLFQSIFLALSVQLIFHLLSKFLLEKTVRQKFLLSVNKKLEQVQKCKKDEIEREQFQKQNEQAKISQEFQKDFDAIINYFAAGKFLLMPKSMVRFDLDELAQNAIKQTTERTEQKNISAQESKEIVAKYRGITMLLHDIEDDVVVELENSLQRIEELLQDNQISESNKSNLYKEYLRIAGNEFLEKSREERFSRKYLDDFEKKFPSVPSVI